MSDVSTWKSAAAGNNASPPDGAPEGMNPATLNNTLREYMAAVKRQRWVYTISNWQRLATGIGTALLCLLRDESAALWYLAGAGGVMLTTPDGLVYTSITTGTAQQVNGMSLGQIDNFFAVLDDGTAIKSTGGTTWSVSALVSGAALKGIAHNGGGRMIAVGSITATFGNGGVWTSGNNNDVWTERDSGVAENLTAVVMRSSTHGVAVGENGTILTTADGGVTWTARTSNTTEHIRAVAWNGVDQYCAVTDNGEIVISTDGTPFGVTWAQAATVPAATHLYGVAHDQNTGYVVVGQNKLILSSPDGDTWSVRYLDASGNFRAAGWAAQDYLLTVGDSGASIRSFRTGA